MRTYVFIGVCKGEGMARKWVGFLLFLSCSAFLLGCEPAAEKQAEVKGAITAEKENPLFVLGKDKYNLMDFAFFDEVEAGSTTVTPRLCLFSATFSQKVVKEKAPFLLERLKKNKKNEQTPEQVLAKYSLYASQDARDLYLSPPLAKSVLEELARKSEDKKLTDWFDAAVGAITVLKGSPELAQNLKNFRNNPRPGIEESTFLAVDAVVVLMGGLLVKRSLFKGSHVAKNKLHQFFDISQSVWVKPKKFKSLKRAIQAAGKKVNPSQECIAPAQVVANLKKGMETQAQIP